MSCCIYNQSQIQLKQLPLAPLPTPQFELLQPSFNVLLEPTKQYSSLPATQNKFILDNIEFDWEIDHLLFLMKIKAMAAMVAGVVQSSSPGSKLHTTMCTARIIFFSIGALSTFHLLKLAVPYSVNLLRSVLPGLWLYIGLNFIILTIAGTSIFHHPPPAKTHVPIDPNEKQLLEETKEVEQEEAHDDQHAISSSPQEPTSPENSCSESSGGTAAKTPATAVDESDSGEKGSSMEATWKVVLKKSKTFDGTRRRREPWMSQEELHSRSEAFIRSFNERLRLQRQESEEQYMAMLSPGLHDKIALLFTP